jgi:mRNA-degrading endonuclease HigB of HigAB toxin-antitoxin module
MNNFDYNKFKKLLWPVSYKGLTLIRVGNKFGDGGYVVPQSIKKIKNIFSIGVGTINDFELELASNNSKIFMADFSVKKPNQSNKNLIFLKKYIKSYDSQKSITFNDWYKNSIKKNKNNNFAIKIDVEGDEYKIILSISYEYLKNAKILIVEFHNFTRILQAPFNKIMCAAFYKILEIFVPVHIHINNTSSILNINGHNIPHTVEFTFERKIPNIKYFYQKNYPNNLDKPNIAHKKELILPKDLFFNDKNI